MDLYSKTVGEQELDPSGDPLNWSAMPPRPLPAMTPRAGLILVFDRSQLAIFSTRSYEYLIN